LQGYKIKKLDFLTLFDSLFSCQKKISRVCDKLQIYGLSVPSVLLLPVVDREVVGGGDPVGDGEVSLMELGSTLKLPKLPCCAAVFITDITSLSFTI